MADMSDVLNVLTNIESLVMNLEPKIIINGDQITVVGGLSDISESLGVVSAGEFRTGNGKYPGDGFSGMRMVYPAVTYGSSSWNLVGVNNDVLQFGVSSTNGKLYAGGGYVVLDENGVKLYNDAVGITTKLRFYEKDTGNYEMGYINAIYDGLGGTNTFNWYVFKRAGDPFSYPEILIQTLNEDDDVVAAVYLNGGTTPHVTIRANDITSTYPKAYMDVRGGTTAVSTLAAYYSATVYTSCVMTGDSTPDTIITSKGSALTNALYLAHNDISFRGTKSSWNTWFGNTMPVYVSSLSIKFEGVDVSAYFPMGTKLDVYQSSTHKYFYVVSSSFSTDTTLVLTAGSVGTTVHATDAITALTYSHYAEANGMTLGSSTFIPLTTPLTSTSWDGGDTVAVGTTNIDTSAVFGAPAGIKGVMAQISGTWGSANNGYYAALRPKGGSTNVMIIRALVASISSDMTGFCPCDANGDLDLVVGGADVTNTVIRIHGYFI